MEYLPNSKLHAKLNAFFLMPSINLQKSKCNFYIRFLSMKLLKLISFWALILALYNEMYRSENETSALYVMTGLLSESNKLHATLIEICFRDSVYDPMLKNAFFAFLSILRYYKINFHYIWTSIPKIYTLEHFQ